MALLNIVVAKMTIYWTIKALIFLFLIEKVTILAEYLNFVDHFLKKIANVLPKQNKANQQITKWIKDK